jgi:hypothetical protein
MAQQVADMLLGNSLPLIGGTGNNLRLQVDKVQTLISTSSTAANSNSYVQQITTTTTIPFPYGKRFTT